MKLTIEVNGAPREVDASPWKRLLDVLRDDLRLTGTKEGCGEGECGACTVILNGVPVNSCLVPTFQARDGFVDTVEGVMREELGPMLASGATQCGACTPGVVMTAWWIRWHKHLLKLPPVQELMAGNLCRCTGYDGILSGIEEWLRAASAPRQETAADRHARRRAEAKLRKEEA